MLLNTDFIIAFLGQGYLSTEQWLMKAKFQSVHFFNFSLSSIMASFDREVDDTTSADIVAYIFLILQVEQLVFYYYKCIYLFLNITSEFACKYNKISLFDGVNDQQLCYNSSKSVFSAIKSNPPADLWNADLKVALFCARSFVNISSTLFRHDIRSFKLRISSSFFSTQ